MTAEPSGFVHFTDLDGIVRVGELIEAEVIRCSIFLPRLASVRVRSESYQASPWGQNRIVERDIPAGALLPHDYRAVCAFAGATP